jgi:hypothetical protein
MRAAARPAEGLHGYNSSWAYEYWGMFLLNNGATILNREGTKYQINSAESLQSAEFWPFYEALPNYIPDPNFPRFTYSKGPINEQLQSIWAGTSSVKDGLNEAQKLAQPILDEALRR